MLSPATSALVVVDVQEAFRSHVHGFDDLVAQARLLVLAATRLDVPVAVSEQYPSGLGSTVPELADVLPAGVEPFAKVEFAAPLAAGWNELPARVRDARQVVVVGIEAHVCIRQSVLALLEAGREVFVPVDAVGSRSALHRDVAIRELVRAGAHESTAEQVMFDWVRTAAAPEFRDLQRLVIDANRPPGARIESGATGDRPRT